METINNDKEAFLFVKKHLLTQGEPAFSINSDCGYRGHTESEREEMEKKFRQTLINLPTEEWYNEEDEDVDYGLLNDWMADEWDRSPYAMCAVGCLIKDKYYDYDFEGSGIDNQSVQNAVALSNPNWKEISIKLLQFLQRVHDSISNRYWDEVLLEDNWEFHSNGKFTNYNGPYRDEIVPNWLNSFYD